MNQFVVSYKIDSGQHSVHNETILLSLLTVENCDWVFFNRLTIFYSIAKNKRYCN